MARPSNGLEDCRADHLVALALKEAIMESFMNVFIVTMSVGLVLLLFAALTLAVIAIVQFLRDGY